MRLIGDWKEKISIEGLMPERALLRLRRAGIVIYDVRKIRKDCIVCSVKKEDVAKVFSVYPQTGYTIYTVRRVQSLGIGRFVEFFKRRVGLLLGAMLALAITLYADRYIFSVEFVGTEVYRREGLMALEEVGITPFAPYKEGKEDIVCARMLALENVEFCSVKKSGNRVLVEVRLSPFPARLQETDCMRAKHAGKLLSLTVLRGTALAEIGEEVEIGERLVGNWFCPQEGEQVCVEPIACASIACVYEGEVPAESEERAFAAAYLESGMENGAQITKKEIIKTDGGYRVRLEYTVVESINF